MADIAGFYGARFSATPPGVDESVWHCQGCNCGGQVKYEWGITRNDDEPVGPYASEELAREELEYWRVWEGSRLVRRPKTLGTWEEVDTDAA